ncbi:MAG: YraN family protein [Gammaproteobacteria bacterium]|nr:YraN family protein [Gammaproteobacteria bacterium]MCP5137251.1 YraN family protein [Gammaproteobacteria bacterium]
MALAHLTTQGLELLGRNYRCRQGEIDLIMRDGASLVFVEVRYRAGNSHGGALQSVDFRKQSKIVHAALHYLQRHTEHARMAARFDVIGLSGDLSGKGKSARIDWIRDAFHAN